MSEPPLAVPSEPAPGLSRGARNILSNWGAFLVTSIVSFLLSPFVVEHLGTSGYGIWVLIASLSGYLGFLDVGVRSAVTRYISKHFTRQEHGEASRVVSSALLVFLTGGLLAVVVSSLLPRFIAGWFKIPAEDEATAGLVMVLAGLNVAISLIGGVFGGVLVGLQRFDVSNSIEVLNTLARAVAIVIVLSAGGHLVALSLVHVCFALAVASAYAFAALRLYPQLEIRRNHCNRHSLRALFSFSVFAFLLQVSSNIIFYSDSIVIGVFLPVGMITYFAIAGNLMNYSRALVSGISTTMTPLASSLEATASYEELRQSFLRRARFASLVLMPVVATFLLRGEAFIGIWMGVEYGPLSGRVLGVLSLSLLFRAASQVATATVLGIGKHKALVPVILTEASLNLVLSITMIGPLGIVGVAWGTTIPNLAVSLFFWPLYMRGILGINPWSYILSGWLRPGLALIPFAAGTLATESIWPTHSLAVFFAQVAGLLPVAAAGAWFVALEAQDRAQIHQRVLVPAVAWMRGR